MLAILDDGRRIYNALSGPCRVVQVPGDDYPGYCGITDTRPAFQPDRTWHVLPEEIRLMQPEDFAKELAE